MKPKSKVLPRKTPPAAPRSWSWRFLRFAVWARRVRLKRHLAAMLFIVALVSAGATFLVLSRPETMNSRTVWVLLNADILIILILGTLVTRAVLKSVLRRRNKRASSRLHLRLTVLFSVVAIVPSIVLAAFLAFTFFLGFESWFNQRVSTAIEESQEVAEAYLMTHKSAIAGEVAILANEINRIWYRLPDAAARDRYLMDQQFRRGLSQVVIFRAQSTYDTRFSGEIIARAGWGFSPGDTDTISLELLDRADNGEIVVLPGQANDQVRAFVGLAASGTYLYVARFVDLAVSDHIRKSEVAAAEYMAFKNHSGQLQLFYFLTYIIVSLMLLLVSVWVGLNIASRLVGPIVRLIDAAERVGEGNLAVRVPELSARDEVALLGRAFNRMTARIDSQHKRLSAANRELDERRRFTETVLAGVSSGVIGVDAKGRIDLPNPSANKLIGVDLNAWSGRPIGELADAFGDLLKEAMSRPDRMVEREVELTTKGNRTLTLLVRVSAECSERGVTGYVFTFDDMTELLSAQRKAAWADVARRIAHEIKNPLTPIQLSAERLRRKYLHQITESPEIFERCTDIIIRHVSDIGQMVDEFSAFARMPQPNIEKTDLVDIVSQAVFLQKTAYGAIAFSTSLPETPLIAPVDRGQITQALTNMLKNAIEAIEGRDKPGDGAPPLPAGRICVSVAREDGKAVIRLIDNGRGLPDGTNVSRLTEPYVTTRAKGTGLGLAIVKKILEDHGGSLTLENAPDQGACVTVVLPLDS